MVANGHHSLFEAMLVAHHLGFKIEPKETLKEFYLQCVPTNIQEDAAFIEFMASDPIQALQLDTYYYEPSDFEEKADSRHSGASSHSCFMSAGQ